ncbi:hypothetical protein [Actinomadura sp. RB99]|uniref:hypothetical protein n=1 Tax=Actinomadura sp. RB99 TaxID=2691577 RepID=UPI001F51002F|nr:hypothetical protein [Actinomadura sp. RB99]
MASWHAIPVPRRAVPPGVEQVRPVLPVVHRQDDLDGAQHRRPVQDARRDHEPDGRAERLGAARQQQPQRERDPGDAEHAQQRVAGRREHPPDRVPGGQVGRADDTERVPAEQHQPGADASGQHEQGRRGGDDRDGAELARQQPSPADRRDVQVPQRPPVPVGRADRARQQRHDDRQQQRADELQARHRVVERGERRRAVQPALVAVAVPGMRRGRQPRDDRHGGQAR